MDLFLSSAFCFITRESARLFTFAPIKLAEQAHGTFVEQPFPRLLRGRLCCFVEGIPPMRLFWTVLWVSSLCI